MSRYIDADRLFETLKRAKVPFNEDVNYFILNAPTVDVTEVRHGRWIIDEWDTPNCSVCGCPGIDDYYATPYCPHCGAKMDEGGDTE